MPTTTTTTSGGSGLGASLGGAVGGAIVSSIIGGAFAKEEAGKQRELIERLEKLSLALFSDKTPGLKLSSASIT